MVLVGMSLCNVLVCMYVLVVLVGMYNVLVDMYR